MKKSTDLHVGMVVTLTEEDDAIVPGGHHIISKINPDGSFHVGGNTAVWPRRLAPSPA